MFDLGSAKVTPGSMGYIDAIAAVLARDPSIRLVIEGHTDVSGSYQRNMMLSALALWAESRHSPPSR